MSDEATQDRPGEAVLGSVSPSMRDYCLREAERTRISDQDLFALCAEQAGLFLTDPKQALPAVLRRVEQALGEGRGLALMRLGDGEGAALGMTLPELNAVRTEAFFLYFTPQNNCRIPTAAAVAFCHELEAAFHGADILGARAFRKDENPLIEQAIDEAKYGPALGLTYARAFLVELLRAGALKSAMLTWAWIHLDLIPHLETLMAMAGKVIVVSGRTQLRPAFEQRRAGRPFEFIEVPPEGDPCPLEASHFASAFPAVKAALDRDLRGTLVLVGAGMFGKIYCAEAKRHGAVAVDMGSAFDLMSGLITRPIFREFSLGGSAWV